MIQVTDIHKTYHSGDTSVYALRGVSLDIDAGEFVAIAGPSGSGKSTLLNILGCLDHPDQGTVSVDGREMVQLDSRGRADYRRHNLGFVFQNFNLIPVLTAFENVAFSLNLLNIPEQEITDRTMAILREVGLEGMEHRRPSRLSGVMSGRAVIARVTYVLSQAWENSILGAIEENRSKRQKVFANVQSLEMFVRPRRSR